MAGTGVAVDAAVLAAPVRVDRAVETDVGRVVVRDDGAGALDGDLGLELGLRPLVRGPAVVEAFARHACETTLQKGPRAPHVEPRFRRIRGHDRYCISRQ